ncbi:PRTRC system ThiF family protein [Deinococcus multiflagellatus]|uniref:PRTRC system ThiF family protein n=1 Tax=Deinococcus multiflagellatus TaxID=1656887 RepID=A0ABW1ZTZ0_9DEIO|nr:PRTRC system ThiF family protein [Deinococcus multiflagellatus]MBZ9714485.1 PRTRC system ThiF family protein [Deinococcus multiflagellatus]
MNHHLKFDPFTLLHVTVVGAGGTGSHLVVLLTELHKCIQALGGQGLMVTVFDPDEVSETNVLRQNYHRQDIGRNKAVTLVSRINLACGTGWLARPSIYTGSELVVRGQYSAATPHILFTCTDQNAARRQIGAAFGRSGKGYWIDTGNTRTTGQVLLSEPTSKEPHLPSPLKEYGELLADDDQDAPSCSALEALTRQDLMVNREVAVKAAGLLWRLLRNGAVNHRGLIVNVQDGITLPKPIEAGMVPAYAAPPVGLIPVEVPPPAPVPAPKRRASRRRATPPGAAA